MALLAAQMAAQQEEEQSELEKEGLGELEGAQQRVSSGWEDS